MPPAQTEKPDSVSVAPEGGARRPRPPTFETLLESVGEFGLYQRALCLGLIGSSTLVCALTYYSQNDWVCNDAWRPFVVHAVFWVGNIVGSWIWGTISDKVGRRPATLASFVVYAAGGALTLAWPSSMAALAAVRFLVGTAHHTISHLPYMLVIEYCGARARVYPLLALIGSWGVGGALLPWIAYLVWDWRIPDAALQPAAPAHPGVLQVSGAEEGRYIPESSSWLMVRGRGEEAATLLRKMAAINGQTLDEEAFGEVLIDMTARDPDKETQSILLVRKHPRLMKNMVLVILLWMVSCLCFYGHTQNTGNLGGSVFSSFSLGATTELLAMTVPFIINARGRKWPMALFFVTSGLCGLLYALLGDAAAV
ncbi:organic cation transporter protein-like [Pollicipes pollicipes]|uniref:organic cation transporter protein-like n=1 Tax=Pollicipes pollicipes TaxID=41117 RepID=UPI00188503F2|nr:organic cation transporter protein-like [Pollicipes pollicipes]